MTSNLRQAVDRFLDGGLDDYVTSRRAAGDSWRQISAVIRERTGVAVAHETVRAWFRGETDLPADEPVSA